MFPTEHETLAALVAMTDGQLRTWIEDFFQHGSPYQAPWPDPDEPNAAKRLQLLCEAPISDSPLRSGQSRLREEVLSFCERYNGTRYGTICGLELLDFTHAYFSRRGALAFNKKLVDATLPWREENGRWIWIEAHRVVSEILAGDWPLIKPWIIRDARLGDAWHHLDDPLRLRVTISALGVWARQGPVNTWAELLELITCAWLHLRRIAQNSDEDAWALILPRETNLLRHIASIVDRVGDPEIDAFSRSLAQVLDDCVTAQDIWRDSLGELNRLELLPAAPAREAAGQNERWQRTAQAVERRLYRPTK